MSSNIKVRLTGFILFVSNLASFLFGFIFTVLVSRNLSQHDLGVWFYIGSVVTYFEFLVKVIPYWAVRDFARGRRVAKTAIMFSGLLSIPLMLCFITLSRLLSTYIETSITVFLVASLLIPLYYVSASVNAILYARYPHKVGWRVPIIDGLKIPLGVALLSFGLAGVLTAIVIANFLYLTYGLYVIRSEFEERIDHNWLKNRFRYSWLPIMQSGIGYINSASDSFLVGTLISPIQLSIYGIGTTISNAVRTSSQLVLPFSMKVLAKTVTTREEITSILKFLSIFTVPMLVGGILLSREIYRIFGSVYVEGAGVLWILILSATLLSYSSLFSGIVSGTEKIDYNLDVSFKSLVKSKLFVTMLIDYNITTMLIVSSLILIPILGVVGAALSRLISSLTALIIFTRICSNYIDVKKNLINFVKIAIACLPMSIYLILFTYPKAIFTILSIFIGATIYFTTLCLIDKESRDLVKKFIKEFTGKVFSILD